MVKIVIAAASSQLANEVIDKLVETKKHNIIGLVRKDPSHYRTLPGVTWIKTEYQDKAALVKVFQGVETILSFFPVHLDKGNILQKRLIDAAMEASVKRFAPAEWGFGVTMADASNALPGYSGKAEIAKYLEEVNKESKVIEYTRFQVGAFMNYLAHPHKTANHVIPHSFQFDFANQRAIVAEGSLDTTMTWTTVQDIAGVVARAVEHDGEWPRVGGISGSRITAGDMLKLGESLGRPFTVEWVRLEDLQAGMADGSGNNLGSNDGVESDLRESTPDQIQAFLKFATSAILVGIGRGTYTVSDEWNRLLPDYRFTQVEEFVRKYWA